MENPLLGQEPLPQFLKIRPEHVEPAVRELLLAEPRAHRGSSPRCSSRPSPRVVEPMEELQHRISRTWSPVSHLNAVLNSDALRAGYNACLPLLSAYQTDLAQSEPLFRAYRTVARAARAQRSAPVQRAAARAPRARLPPCRAWGCRRAQGALQDRDARADAAAGEVRGERARCHQRLEQHVTATAQLAGLNEMLIEQARAPRRRARPARLGAEPRSADLRRGGHGCGVASRCGAPSTRPGPRAPRTRARTPAAGTTRAVMEEILQAPPRGGAPAGFPQLRRVRARHAHGAQRRGGAEVPARARPAPRARPRRRSSPNSRPSPAASSPPGTSASTPSGCSASASRSRRRSCAPTSRCRACSPACSRSPSGSSACASASAHGAPVWHPDARLFDIETAARRAGGQLLPRRLRAPQQAQRRLDGRVRRPQAPRQRARRCRWPTWCAISCRPASSARRC